MALTDLITDQLDQETEALVPCLSWLNGTVLPQPDLKAREEGALTHISVGKKGVKSRRCKWYRKYASISFGRSALAADELSMVPSVPCCGHCPVAMALAERFPDGLNLLKKPTSMSSMSDSSFGARARPASDPKHPRTNHLKQGIQLHHQNSHPTASSTPDSPSTAREFAPWCALEPSHSAASILIKEPGGKNYHLTSLNAKIGIQCLLLLQVSTCL